MTPKTSTGLIALATFRKESSMAHHHPILWTFIALLLLGLVGALTGCSTNGHPMRFSPVVANPKKSKSWLIEGRTDKGAALSCSFVEFDERGDFLDFQQHTSCEAQIASLVQSNRVLVVIYCHGWKNSSQSGDVLKFNSFLARLADSEEIRQRGMRVHGVYLGWRGNAFKPYINRSGDNQPYQDTTRIYGEPIVDREFQRRFDWTWMVPENLSYWNRKAAAEHKVSGLPMARAIFTYAAAAKNYGAKLDNRVVVMGHSFGALMLEKSLGQAMTGEITLEWWNKKAEGQAPQKIGLPFDLILFVNSAAPAIYAKEMRDFLEAHRRALGRARSAAQDAPVIISVTSTADAATGVIHPIGNMCAPFAPSLQRRYTTGIFGDPAPGGTYPTHRGIRQSEFYTRTPGHQPYLVNHWIVKQDSGLVPTNANAEAIFSANLSTNKEPDLFFTSAAKYPAAAWKISRKSPDKPVTLDGLPPAMADSDYWIVSCGKELIAGHNDVWSTTTMEMYAGLFRAAESRLGPARPVE